MLRSVVFTTLLVLVTTVFTAAAQDIDTTESVPVIKAHRVNPHAPKIDGILDDAVWQSDAVQKSTEFTQDEPDEGEAPTESTMVAVVYDDHALYVAFWCYDSEPEEVARQLVRRDRDSRSDRVTLAIDAFHDHRTANRFLLNAAGVQEDIRYYNDDWSDRSWDAVWEGKAKQQPWGWSAEMKIPYHCLRFNESDKHVWGVNFTRWIERKGEYIKWAFSPSEESGFVSKFGHLTGIEGISPATHIELLPYAVSKLETEPRSLANEDGRDFLGNTGFDVKYSLGSDLILDATVNPDFGQVELDRPDLNLSVFETWFDEKRPFFIEGADLFSTDFALFYSRRIGRPPENDVDDGELAYYTDYPDATTILGAAKLTGKLSSGTSIAFLNALTEQEYAKYAAETNVVTDSVFREGEWADTVLSADTVFREGLVEPTANYSVFRIKQDVLHNSSVGGMLTVASQSSVHPFVTGGVDWRLFTNSNAWGVDGQAIFSRVDPDNTGYGLDITFQKSGGKHVRGSLGVTVKDPELYINRLGFTSRVDTKRVWLWTQYRTTDDWWIIRNSWNNINFNSDWNYDNVNHSLGGNFNTYIEFTNFWSLGGGITIQAEKYSDLETRGLGLWEWTEYPTWSWWFSLDTDYRRPVQFNWNPGGGRDRGGHWYANYLGVALRPKSNLEFELGVNYHMTTNATRWVTNTDDDRSLFADLDQDRLTIYSSANIIANRNLSFQLSAQGLVSGLDYKQYRYYMGGRNYSEEQWDYDYDRNYAALNSTFVMRWEYLPGSTFYFVWTRALEDNNESLNDLDLSRDLDRLFSGSAKNVFLIKSTYWLNI